MIRISFADWWMGFDIHDNFITQALDHRVEYQIVTDPEQADFVFCSVWKKDCFKYKCPRILFVGENCVPDFNIYDYAIGFENLEFGDRYIRYPLYVAQYEEACRKIEAGKTIVGNEHEREFCSFVVSNGYHSDSYRERLFEKLSDYKPVASGGRYRNNLGLEDGVKDKQEFVSRYKFNISCENVSHKGYCTEKIVEAYAAGTIPIYWGDPDVAKYFNPKSFINCHDYDSIDEVIEQVKMVDDNPDMYMSMLSEPPILEGKYSFDAMRKEFTDWLVKVVSQDTAHAYRRSLYGYSLLYEKEWLSSIHKMNRVGIITFHFVNNYGGVLQAYALQKVIGDMGYKVSVIDYRNWFIRFTDAVRMIPITKRIDVFMAGIRSFGARKERISRINRFIEGRLCLTRRLRRSKLHELEDSFDKFICGSDQIWNPIITGGVDKAYYLTFVRDNKKKISYAPSMGTGRIPSFWLKKMFCMINDMSFLSIRERSTEELLSRELGRTPEILVDPTLLIDRQEWERIADRPKNLPDRYILLYMMQGDEKIYEYARSMKETYNVPIVEISRYGYNPGFADQIMVDVGIEEFLGLFLNATYICTNSYHGFVYSMIFRKDLCLIPSVHFSARISNLLKLLGMSDEALSTKDRLLVDIDYDAFDRIVKTQKDKAFDYLQRALDS